MNRDFISINSSFIIQVKPKPIEVSHLETTVHSNPPEPIKSSESTTIPSTGTNNKFSKFCANYIFRRKI